MASKEDDDDANPGEAQGITLSAAQVVISCGRSCCVALFPLRRAVLFLKPPRLRRGGGASRGSKHGRTDLLKFRCAGPIQVDLLVEVLRSKNFPRQGRREWLVCQPAARARLVGETGSPLLPLCLSPAARARPVGETGSPFVCVALCARLRSKCWAAKWAAKWAAAAAAAPVAAGHPKRYRPQKQLLRHRLGRWRRAVAPPHATRACQVEPDRRLLSNPPHITL